MRLNSSNTLIPWFGLPL